MFHSIPGSMILIWLSTIKKNNQKTKLLFISSHEDLREHALTHTHTLNAACYHGDRMQISLYGNVLQQHTAGEKTNMSQCFSSSEP